MYIWVTFYFCDNKLNIVNTINKNKVTEKEDITNIFFKNIYNIFYIIYIEYK